MASKIVTEKGIMRLADVTSSDIISLLEQKHYKDAFIQECKNGETWGARDLLKMDAWVLLRTYSPLTMIGYEVKTSRQDFERDQKWPKYLDMCHQFYFVCPSGLIRATDLPSRVGIIWASKNRLYTKRKAERVDPDMEKVNRLLIYIVMARSRIVANMYAVDKDEDKPRMQLIREAIEEANERKSLAYFVKGHIRERQSALDKRERDLSFREDCVKNFEEKLALLGITWQSENSNWGDRNQVESEINLLKERIDWRTLDRMKGLAQNLGKFVEEIEFYRKTARGEVSKE